MDELQSLTDFEKLIEFEKLIPRIEAINKVLDGLDFWAELYLWTNYKEILESVD